MISILETMGGIAHRAGSQGPEQCREGSENNIRKHTSGQDIAEKTAECQTRDRGGSEERHDRKCFRKADLYGAAREIEPGGDHGQDCIERGDQGRLSDISGFL